MSSPRAPDPAPASATARWLVPLVLVVQVTLLLDAARRDSATFDEPLFIAGGLASWEGRHHLFPEGGALPQRLAALPLRLDGRRLPIPAEEIPAGAGYVAGRDVLSDPATAPRLLFLARLPVIAVTALLTALVAFEARRLFGPGCGVAASALIASCPVVLGHGHLATADVLAALTLPAAVVLLDRCLARPSPGRLALSGAVAAAALLAKMSVILVPPAVVLVVLLRLLAGTPMRTAGGIVAGRSAGWAGRAAGILLLHAAIAAGGAWAAHDVRYDPAPGAPDGALKHGGWERHGGRGPLAGPVEVARAARLLPEAWLYGLQYTVAFSEARRTYAEGRHGLTGWAWFFPRVAVLKLPLLAFPCVLLGAWALSRAWRAGRRLTRPESDAAEDAPAAAWARSPAGADLLALAPHAAFVGLYLLVAMTSSLNIGIRHLLPVLPAALLLGGAAWRLAEASRPARWLVGALLALAVAEGAGSHPHSIAWMNVLAGPEERRWERFVDSSLDWGQGLRESGAVAESLRREGEDLYLSTFGSVDPRSEGLRALQLPSFFDHWRDASGLEPGPGLYLVSATMLVQVLSETPGPWTQALEDEWRRSVERLAPWWTATAPERRALVEGPERERWGVLLRRHDHLLFGRLCAALRERQPLASPAGGAMLLYRLDDAALREALFGPVPVFEGDEPIEGMRELARRQGEREGR